MKKKSVSFCLCDDIELKAVKIYEHQFKRITRQLSCNAMIRVVLCQSEEAGVNEW